VRASDGVAGGVDRLLLTTFLRPGETGDRDKGELSRVPLSWMCSAAATAHPYYNTTLLLD